MIKYKELLSSQIRENLARLECQFSILLILIPPKSPFSFYIKRVKRFCLLQGVVVGLNDTIPIKYVAH